MTEHGNMFSSVVFHDHARVIVGIKPILGCEVTSRREAASTERSQTETNHLSCWRRQTRLQI